MSNFEGKKILVDVIRNEIAKNGGSSVLSGHNKLLTIQDGLEVEYDVLHEFGCDYAIIEEE